MHVEEPNTNRGMEPYRFDRICRAHRTCGDRVSSRLRPPWAAKTVP